MSFLVSFIVSFIGFKFHSVSSVSRMRNLMTTHTVSSSFMSFTSSEFHSGVSLETQMKLRRNFLRKSETQFLPKGKASFHNHHRKWSREVRCATAMKGVPQ